MNTKKKYIQMMLLLLIMTTVNIRQAQAIGLYPDAARAYEWSLYGEKVKKMMIAQQGQQLLVIGEHYNMKKENERMANIQRQMNEYLDSLHSWLTYAAHLYGLYYEASQITSNISMITKACNDNPEGILAAAFMGNERTDVFLRITTTSVGLACDLYTVFKERKKLTEKEGFEMINHVRLKLREMNSELHSLAVYIHYTNFNDVLNRLLKLKKRFQKRTNAEIATECLRNWKAHYGLRVKDYL